jgi:hypothetical protein
VSPTVKLKTMFRDDVKFESMWERFLSENDHVSVFYTLHWMEYQRYYSEDRFVDDLSFILLGGNNEPLAICPLYLENYNGLLRFSYRGEFLESLRTPLISQGVHRRYRKKTEKELYRIIDDLAKRHNVQKCNFLIDPLCAIYEDERYNYLTQYGYLNASIATQIIGLGKSEEKLWAELRQSYKALINKADKEFEVVLMDYRDPAFDVHDNYRILHHKAAGRVTRPIETFNLQFEMLKNDEAMLLGIKYQNQFVTFAYFIHLNRTAYYASEADDPDIEIPVTCGPLMQWKAMQYYRARGFDYMELDNQQFGPQVFDHPSKKDIKISFFKRGFGGKTFPLFRGMKYYNKELLKQELMENVEELMGKVSDDK